MSGAMIKAIFFTRFHPKNGPTVLHQVPDGSIVSSSSPSAVTEPFFHFPCVSEYIIPPQSFCDQLLTICINKYRIIGYPVCINDNKYERNEFIFNFAVVLDEDADMSGLRAVVRKIAKLFRSLEEQGGFLSKEEGKDLEYGTQGKVYALCEMILEDLNNYCECMIPIDESATINLKLSPTLPSPPPIYAYHVPLSTLRLTSLHPADLTMSRILPYIDGVNSVSRIAALSDTDLQLTRKAIAHLLYHNCLILLDVFQFGAVYAVTAEIGALFADEGMQEECVRYVSISTANTLDGSGLSLEEREREVGLRRQTVLQLYANLSQGVPLRRWAMEHREMLDGIDVRRFITFGVIKGFIYRVHRYAVSATYATGLESRKGSRDERGGRVGGRASKESGRGTVVGAAGRDMSLMKYLDGMRCFDDICTELQMSEKQVMARLREYGDVQTIYR